MTSQRFFWASVGAGLVCASVANACLIVVDFTSAGQGASDNVGFEYQPVDVNGNLVALLLTARSSIDTSFPFDPFAPGSLGTIFVDNMGTGVQNESGGGSKEISGSGPNGDEELILIFDIAVPRDYLALGLKKYDPGNGLGDKDDPAIFVFLTDGTYATFDETHIETDGDGMTGTLFLNKLLPEDAMVAQIIVRETNKHMLVGSLQFVTTTCPWDLDCDGTVGASDLLLLLNYYGGSCEGCPQDFDGDGNVGATDLLALLFNWGPCP